MIGLAAFAVGFVLAAGFATWLVRRHLPVEQLRTIEGPAGDLYMAGMMGLYGVLVAFVLGGVWDRLESARDAAGAEMLAVVELADLARSFPPRQREQLEDGAKTYLQGLLDEKHGVREAVRGADILAGMRAEIATWEPSGTAQATLQSTVLDRIGIAFEKRRERLVTARSNVPPVLWALLLFGAAATVTLGLFASFRPVGLQMGIVMSLAALIAAALVTIRLMDEPGLLTSGRRIDEGTRVLIHRLMEAQQPK